MAVAGAAAILEPDASRLWLDCALGWVLLTLGWIDARYLRLPDVLTLPLIPAGLVVALVRTPDEILDRALAAVAGYACLRAVALGYRAWRGREGLGQGDAKLLAAAGAWVGLAAVFNVLLGGAIITLLTVLPRAHRLTAATALPFGPGLCLAFWLTWLWS